MKEKSFKTGRGKMTTLWDADSGFEGSLRVVFACSFPIVLICKIEMKTK